MTNKGADVPRGRMGTIVDSDWSRSMISASARTVGASNNRLMGRLRCRAPIDPGKQVDRQQRITTVIEKAVGYSELSAY